MPPSPTVPSRHCGRSQSGPESPSRASQSPRTPGAPRARSLRAAVLLTLGALVGGASLTAVKFVPIIAAASGL